MWEEIWEVPKIDLEYSDFEMLCYSIEPILGGVKTVIDCHYDHANTTCSQRRRVFSFGNIRFGDSPKDD